MEKAKRTRRTKAQMEEARNKEAAAKVFRPKRFHRISMEQLEQLKVGKYVQ